ncbi:hypothetical protein HYV84_05490 [Candidatus Woesearchaeota archaeon]|nr:hypothetical protein [Candidatus Woesearchaeota archaeon]
MAVGKKHRNRQAAIARASSGSRNPLRRLFGGVDTSVFSKPTTKTQPAQTLDTVTELRQGNIQLGRESSNPQPNPKEDIDYSNNVFVVVDQAPLGFGIFYFYRSPSKVPQLLEQRFLYSDQLAEILGPDNPGFPRTEPRLGGMHYYCNLRIPPSFEARIMERLQPGNVEFFYFRKETESHFCNIAQDPDLVGKILSHLGLKAT